ncbi:MAG: M48 family metallopeptidase [Selenomonadaceae bacterium]|nr:M48 family metallopeptidase [Selenomonadaceae bacterium]
MNKTHQKKFWSKIVGGFVAFSLAIGASYTTLPTPTASASAASIIGAVIGGAVQATQINSAIKKYNKTEEGRQELFAAMQQKYGVNSDPELNRRLDRIMSALTSAIGQVDPTVYDKPYLYFVNNDKSFNAFCSLGHVMSVNTGLFNAIQNEDEIAVVIGHEMGHGQKDHPAKGMRRSIGPAILANATGSIAGVIVANIWNNQGITKPQEWEADNLAFEYLTHSNYNPGACAAIWQRVMDQSGSGGDSFAHLMVGGSDHPSNKERRNNYAKKLAEYSGKHVAVEDGNISVNGQFFCTPAAASDMSGAERSYFVAGNLAAAFHNGQNKLGATSEGSTVKLGNQPIIIVTGDDESASVLAERLNSLL